MLASFFSSMEHNNLQMSKYVLVCRQLKHAVVILGHAPCNEQWCRGLKKVGGAGSCNSVTDTASFQQNFNRRLQIFNKGDYECLESQFCLDR